MQGYQPVGYFFRFFGFVHGGIYAIFLHQHFIVLAEFLFSFVIYFNGVKWLVFIEVHGCLVHIIFRFIRVQVAQGGKLHIGFLKFMLLFKYFAKQFAVEFIFAVYVHSP